MKTLFVSVAEWVDIGAFIIKLPKGLGGQGPKQATYLAIKEVLGREIAACCLEGVRVEIVTALRGVTNAAPGTFLRWA